MKNKKIYWVVLIVGLLIQVSIPQISHAAQVQAVETEGSIGFTGTYVPIGTPDPKPPIQEITKPDGSLPQTNMTTRSWVHWLGMLLVGLVLWLHKTRKQTKRKRECLT